MQSAIVEEFAHAVLVDNALLAQTVALGEPVTPAEMIELSAASRALYNTCVLAGRELEHVSEHHKLWQAAVEVFAQMRQVWDEVNGNELARLHVNLLGRLHSLSLDRAALYDVSAAERLSFAQRNAPQGKSLSAGQQYNKTNTLAVTHSRGGIDSSPQ
jgi:hypothetical protein